MRHDGRELVYCLILDLEARLVQEKVVLRLVQPVLDQKVKLLSLLSLELAASLLSVSQTNRPVSLSRDEVHFLHVKQVEGVEERVYGQVLLALDALAKIAEVVGEVLLDFF